jgi:hypothetical protein
MRMTSSLLSRKTFVNQLGISRIAASGALWGSFALSVAAPRTRRPASVKKSHQVVNAAAGRSGAIARHQR